MKLHFATLPHKVRFRSIAPVLLSFVFLSACQKEQTILVCGGASDFPCPPHMYCDLGEHCGGIDRTGTCRVRPEFCPDDEQLVCGCNRETIKNPCWAALKAVTILHDGACDENS